MNELTKEEPSSPVKKVKIWNNAKRAENLLVVFWILTGLSIIAIVSSYLQLELLKKAQLGEFITEDQANTNDLRQQVIGILQTILYIVSVIVFLNWFRRAYGNLLRLGIKGVNHKESMAIWSWIIPIISLFRPVQIMNEIWNKTQEKIKTYDPSYLIKNGEWLIGLWWTLFILSNLVGRYILKTAFRQDSIDGFIISSQAQLISDAIQLSEALLVILIVSQLSKIELKLMKEVKRAGGIIVNK